MKGRKWICALLALVLLLAIVPLPAGAIDLIDLSKKGSLKVTFCYDTKPLEGAEFRIYRVAGTDEFCTLEALGPFAEWTSHVDLNNMDQPGWKDLAVKLAADVRANSLEPYRTGKTDAEGMVQFSDLELGLYLVFSAPHTQDHGAFEHLPVLIMVPYRNQNPEAGDIDTWQYQDISLNGKPVEAKNALKVIKIWDDNHNAAHKRPEKLIVYLLKNGVAQPDKTIELPVDGKWEYVWENLEYGPVWTVREDTTDLKKVPYECGDPVRDDKGTEYIIWTITNRYTPPPEPQLPQTGQLWWPVPVLLSVGMLCILVGMLRRRGEQHEE